MSATANAASEKFGAGPSLTALLSVEFRRRESSIVLSCRVMSCQIEHTVIRLAAKYCPKTREQSQWRHNYIETPKNKPCYEFWMSSRFSEIGDRFV